MISETTFQKAHILIIDDEKANIRFLEIILAEAGYSNVHSILDSRLSLDVFRETKPDLVLLDLAMPHLSGFEVLKQLNDDMVDNPVPIMVLTADATSQVRLRSLKEGARDFLTKPLEKIEVLLRIHNLLETHFHSVLLESQVRERTQELEIRTDDLEKAQMETLQRLALAAEYRDDNTGVHTRRVGIIAGSIARVLDLPVAQVDLICHAAPLHDVGKIGISDSILLKPGKLTASEFSAMRTHTVIGAKILSGGSSPLLQMAREIALTHHEHFDGKGYPRNLAGENIPLAGRIVAVADVFDALTHERPYKSAWSIEAAIAEIEGQSGSQFDANVVSAFLTLTHENLI